MKPRLAALIFILVSVVLIVWLLRYSKHGRASLEPGPRVGDLNNVQMASGSNNTRQMLITQPSPASPVVSNQPPTAISQNQQEVIERFIQIHNVPIEFYGKVIDQDSNPLVRADVKAVVVRLKMPGPMDADMGATNISVERSTGADGRFEISGVEGTGFDLESIEKDSYEVEQPKRGHAPQEGTFDQPVIFKMWSTNIHEQLITGEKNFTIIPDGRSYFVDLNSGTINESGSGNFKIWIKRPAQIVYGHKYDWSCELDAVNGGLLEEQLGAVMYEAPESEYTSSFKFVQKIGSGWGDTTGPKQFYINLNNGQEYGQMTIELEAYYNNQIPALIHISYVINPSGSRILR